MTPPEDPKRPEFDVRLSELFQRGTHRKDTSAFLWGTWLMLLLAIGLGYDTLQGFRSGEWIDVSSDDRGLLVPWWLAAVLVLGILLLSLWCFGQYNRLKDTEPPHSPSDEKDSDE